MRLIICLSFLFCTCSKATQSEVRFLLDMQKQSIYNYVAQFSCNGDSQCAYMPLGVKPCGGPWEYLIYPATVNLETLEEMVQQYNEDETNYNKIFGIFSDCSFVSAPDTIYCFEGACRQ